MVAPKPSAPEKALNVFVQPFRQAPASGAPWLTALREVGLQRFIELGVPTSSREDWRFTNLAPLLRLPFRPVQSASLSLLGQDRLAQLAFGALPGPCLVFVDGHFAPALSRTTGTSVGVEIRNLAEVLAGNGQVLEPWLARHARSADGPFAALNAAYFTDGGYVHVAAGATMLEPIHFVFVTTRNEVGVSTQVHNVVRADRDSRVTVLESYFSLTPAAHFTNVVTDVVAGDGARVEHLRFQDEHREALHLATVQGDFGASSQVHLHSFALGARLSRCDFRTHLGGEGLECVLNGLYLTRGDQLADHHMVVEHAKPQGASHEYFNGILDDRSRGVFHGRILVQPIAQKTDAKQTNKNILLSDDAQVSTKPQLEIYADDVKCTHGATVGQLNEDSIFYLRARGIGLERARRMLIHAFAGEIIERVQCDPAREALDRLVWNRLEENPRIAAGADSS